MPSPEPATDPTMSAETPAAPLPPKRSRKALIAIVLLALALAAALGACVFYFIKLDEATARIDEQNRQIEEQEDLIDRKEVFGTAMTSLVDTAAKFDGVLMGSLVPFERYELYARQGWAHRWDADDMARDVAEVQSAAEELEALLTTATAQATSNTTGTTYEAVIDQLGGGFVSSLVYEADVFCEADVLACVASNDPYTVHFDSADYSLPHMNDVLRTGIAYHEFAHVLQISNPDVTETALEAFGGDDEIMADCFALTYLDGWKLDHRVWVSSYQYWEVSLGYGYTCDEAQRQVIRDWYGQLGFRVKPISQER